MSLFDDTPATEEEISSMFANMKKQLLNDSALVVSVDSWDDYEGYLKSKSWQKVKDNFNYEYDGFQSICMVSGIRGSIHHHHWTYPDDLHDDSPSNLILVCSQVHKWIHDDDSAINKKAKLDAKTRSSYLTTLIGMWNEAVYKEGLEVGYNKGFADAAEKVTKDASVAEFKRGYKKGLAESRREKK